MRERKIHRPEALFPIPLRKITIPLLILLLSMVLLCSPRPVSVLAAGESDTGVLNWTSTSKENFYGARSHFVGLVFGDVSNLKDVEGKLAVGGDLTPTGGGTSVNGGYLGGENTGSDEDALILGGDIRNPGSDPRVGVNGRALVGGTVDAGVVVETLRPGGTTGTYEPIAIGDFFTAGEAEFTAISREYAALSSNGAMTYYSYQQDFQAVDPEVSTIVYNVSESTFNALNFNIAPDQKVIVNFTAAEVTFGYGGMTVNGSNDDTYLRGLTTSITLNFPNATKINVGGTSLYGMMIAPQATVTPTTFGGNIAGTLICRNILGNGGGFELHLGLAGHSKNETPTLTKEVEEKDDTNGNTSWEETADHDIGDAVPFRLMGTTPPVSIFDRYSTYYYAFHDTLSPGLTFRKDVAVTLVRGAETVYTFDPEEYNVQIEEDGQTFRVEFPDLKAGFGSQGDVKVQGGDRILVTYTAELNENAVVGGAGNPNEASLEYSREPGSAEHGETLRDKAVVFTFRFEADKVDESDQPLTGAAFRLYKLVEGAYIPVGEEQKDRTAFLFTGLDAGAYKLVETDAPSGYNKAEDLEFRIDAKYDGTELEELQVWTTGQDPVRLDTGEGAPFTCIPADGRAVTHIVNHSGAQLPETGGRGTRGYQAAGITLIALAAVFLVRRRFPGPSA